MGSSGLTGLNSTDLDAGILQALEDVGLGGVGAVAVIDDVDRDALLRLGDQQVAQLLAAGLHVLENVIFQIDRRFRALDGGEHGREGLGAVHQQMRGIAGHQGRFGDGFLDRHVALQDAGIARFRRDLFQQRLALPLGQRAPGAHDLAWPALAGCRPPSARPRNSREARKPRGQSARACHGLSSSGWKRPPHLCSLASSLTSCPAWETSLPAPSTVLQALRNEDAPTMTTRLANVIERYLRMMESFCRGRAGAN